MVLNLKKENEDLRKKLAKKKRARTSSSSSSSSSEDEEGNKGDPKGFRLDAMLKRTYKKKAIKQALPFDSNEAMQSVIEDKDGDTILRHLFQAAVKEAIEKEEGTYDTAMRSRVLAHKIVRTLFSDTYLGRYKFFNPRPAYRQAQGTAMAQNVYEWFRDVVSDLASAYYAERQQQNRFDWEELLVKLRQVWTWDRNNIRKRKQRNIKKAKK